MTKIDQIIHLVEKAVLIIKGRFHNRIALTIAASGVLLIFGSQINLMTQIVIVKFSPWIDVPPEDLRSIFTIDPNPEIGLILIIVALIYHAVVTIGLERIQSYKAKYPKLELAMLNGDQEKIGENYTLRGAICSHSIDEIPDNTSYSEQALEEKKKMTDYSRSWINKNFYRDRAKCLSSWGGMEIIGLTVENSGATLASNVRVELSIKRSDGVSAYNENCLLLMLPSRETKEEGINYNTTSYDIKSRHTSSDYFFEWIVGNIQPKQLRESKTRIFFRTESDVDIKVKIYCDELPDPIVKSYKIKPTSERFEFDLNLLKCNDKDFSDATNKKIMDGQQIRYINKWFEQSNLNKSAIH
ncbi:hypothetical protein [Methylobacter tundripaludum]|uniref:hypothetical protein n=1 Tax=Methylobacter tundripaludum TaxID=173365 RepID=UPI0004875275|nr:hypothetical protein [Methylobacter tundripaludum]